VLVGSAAVAALALAGAALWLAAALRDVPELDVWRRHALAPAAGPIAEGEVRVTFLGVATLLIRDRDTSLLTDGFFSRPGRLATLFGRIAPDPDAIARGLARAGIGSLAAVIVVHSHYDHAMDAPEVARRTGALLVGSESTANVGRGAGLDESRIRVPEPGSPLAFGEFRVTLVASEHFPHGMAMGEIREPLVPPARALDYRDGGSFSVLVEHPSGSLLVQGSAGWRDGALAGRSADVVLLGIGGLGSRDDAYREAYFREVVDAVGARRVLPIHWDDFTRGLDQPLRPFPRRLDDFEASMRFLEARARRGTLELGWLPPLEPVRVLGGDG
jgi:L-ascorbate metabolism protein UlaG (beta-lactamase superfamily)